MSSQHPFDDASLTQYLLGALPADDAERVDEASITNDEIAWRLRAMENDLVDAYARGELSGTTLEQFRTSYLENPERRKRVVIATALRDREQPAEVVSQQWIAWAAAVLIAVLAIGYAVFTRRGSEPAVRTVLVARKALNPPGPWQTFVTLDLAPPTRGTAALPTLAVSDRKAQAVLRPQLESDDFPEYAAAVRDLATGEVVAHSGHLKPVEEGNTKFVSVIVPASTLKEQNYSIELSGVPSGRPAELIASYAFHVSFR